LSALTGGVRVASCKGPRGRRPGVKTLPDRGLTSARALQPPAQPRQKSLKASIVRGSLVSTVADILPTSENVIVAPVEVCVALAASSLAMFNSLSLAFVSSGFKLSSPDLAIRSSSRFASSASSIGRDPRGQGSQMSCAYGPRIVLPPRSISRSFQFNGLPFAITQSPAL
jgi:hypothetical protein